jgi:CheY-like chemotaxis protein/HPt (histidine-containing phosphotransfer) domain-containing protein
LKGDPSTASIPVIALTALAMKADEERTRIAGCDAYIAKPLRYQELYAVIDSLLEKAGGPAGQKPVREQAPAANRPKPGPATFAPDPSRRDGRLILVAEDNETNQEVIRRQLALLGLAADVVANGRVAYDRWRSGDHALLLTDLHMPELDGYELAQRIREDERGGGTRRPIIALSANAMKEEALRCEAAGMDGYLSKPAQLAQLKAMLERWLPSPAAPLPPARRPALDLSALTRLVGDDPAVTMPILNEFVTVGRDVAQRLEQACREGDAPQAAAQAHKFKSSSASVGAKDLAELCRALEAAALAGRLETLATLQPLFAEEWRQVEAQAQQALAAAAAP